MGVFNKDFVSRLILPTAIVCISSASIIIRLAEAPPLVIAFYRLGYAAVLHALLSLRSPREYQEFDSNSMLKSMLAGVVLGGHFVLWIYSLHYTTVAASTVLVSFHPILAAAAGYILLGEKLSLRRVLCIVAALIGVGFIASAELTGGAGSLIGDLMAVAAAGAMAVYLITGRDVRRTVKTLPYTTIVYSTAAVSVLLLMMAVGESPWGFSRIQHLLFLLLAIMPTLLGHTLLNWALGYMQTAPVAVATLGEPVGATVLAYLMLGEIPGWHQLVGAVFILGALVFFGLGGKNEVNVDAHEQK